jgi:hypothetical protein
VSLKGLNKNKWLVKMSLSEFNNSGYTAVIAVVTVITTNISILSLDGVTANW